MFPRRRFVGEVDEMKVHTQTFTNDEIITSPTIPLVIDLPALGMGKRYVYFGGFYVLDNVAGVYSNVATDDQNKAYARIKTTDGAQLSAVGNADWGLVDGSEKIIVDLPPYVDRNDNIDAADPQHLIDTWSDYQPAYENSQMALCFFNGTDPDLGNFGDGHPDNTLKLTIYYALANL